MSKRSVRTSLLLASVLMAGLSGCGKGAAKSEAGPNTPRGIFTSANDCAESGLLPLETCSELIVAAISEHEISAPSYNSEGSCQKAEGDDRCERTAENKFRPRLAAFLITVSEPPAAKPLYLNKDNKHGFRGSDKTTFLADDDTLKFSKPALAAAEPIEKRRKR